MRSENLFVKIKIVSQLSEEGILRVPPFVWKAAFFMSFLEICEKLRVRRGLRGLCERRSAVNHSVALSEESSSASRARRPPQLYRQSLPNAASLPGMRLFSETVQPSPVSAL